MHIFAVTVTKKGSSLTISFRIKTKSVAAAQNYIATVMKSLGYDSDEWEYY